MSDLNREEIVGTFYGKELQKTIQKDYNSFFNSWIDTKDIV